MERSEPNLIPQWLKGSRNVTGAGTTGHQTPLSSWLYDDHALSKHGRNRSSNVNCHDIGRSVGNRTTSTYFRRSSTNNGSGLLRTQSSFGRGRGDRECERVTFDFRRCDYSDPSENILQSRVDKDLRGSQSLITGKFNNNKSNQNNSNDLVVGNSLMSPNHKIAFERNFPSLGVDEKQTALELRRVSSLLFPPIILGGDRWTSALADVPIMFGSVGPGGVVEQPITSAVASMAETVAQGSSHANNNISQLPVGNQRLEELVLKQSRQLIPIQTMLKSSVLSPSEKAKAKISHPHQNPSSLTNLSPRGGAGKLQVLKSSAREKNGGPLISKDISPPTDDSVVISSSSSSSAATPDRRQASPFVEKRLTQARSRNDFFNLVRKNSMSSPSSSVVAEISSAVEQSDGDSVVDQSTMKANNDDNNVKSNSVLYSEEKEAAFLRSLGWEENNNNGDDEGLTEEEINTFYKDMNEYMKLKPTLKSSQKLFGPGNLSSFHSSNGSATFSGSKASS